ncbi:MAG: hypothetical protein HZB41_07950, partial [Ignavibacteriae bacterium]|nr:hypothetical protein [Ignavibacteriota bacterium]
RDILILIGGLYVSKKIGYVVYSDIIGKYSVTILALMMLGIIYKIELFSIYGIYIALIALIVSFVNYLIRMIKLLKNSTGK